MIIWKRKGNQTIIGAATRKKAIESLSTGLYKYTDLAIVELRKRGVSKVDLEEIKRLVERRKKEKLAATSGIGIETRLQRIFGKYEIPYVLRRRRKPKR